MKTNGKVDDGSVKCAVHPVAERDTPDGIERHVSIPTLYSCRCVERVPPAHTVYDLRGRVSILTPDHRGTEIGVPDSGEMLGNATASIVRYSVFVDGQLPKLHGAAYQHRVGSKVTRNLYWIRSMAQDIGVPGRRYLPKHFLSYGRIGSIQQPQLLSLNGSYSSVSVSSGGHRATRSQNRS